MPRVLLVFLLAGLSTAEEPVKNSPTAETPLVRSLSFSPDGSVLAVASVGKVQGSRVHVFRVNDQKLLVKSDPVGEVPIAVFAADGKSIVLASSQKALTVLDAKTAKKSGELGPLPSEVTTLQAAGPDKWMLRGKDSVFRLWDEKDRKVAGEFSIGKEVWAWGVSPAGKWLFINGSGNDKFWNLTTGAEVPALTQSQANRANVAAFVSEDQVLLGSNYGSHRLIELPSGKELLRFRNEGGTGALAYSPATAILACRYYTDASAALTPLSLRAPTAAEKTRVGDLLKACDSDDYATREKAASDLAGLDSPVEPLLREAATAGTSAEVRMRARVARATILNKARFKLTGHLDEIRVMAFSPDGKVFATGGADGMVILWDPLTGKELSRLSTSN